jgi:glyoxylase-like metal-dependent hydrolase (beta-lactamase superfamily II)
VVVAGLWRARGGGDLLPSLTGIGVAPASIDRVVLTHHHGDHVGGLAPEGTPAFPNASVHVSAAEMAFLEGAPEDNGGAQSALAAIQASGGAQTFTDGAELAPGLTAVMTPGHTPGHAAVLLESDGARLMFAADAIAHPVAFFEHPEWVFRFDQDPERTVETRYALLERVAEERIPFMASHLPFPALGRVSRMGAGFRFTTAPYAP